MKDLKIYSKKNIEGFINKRKGEVKFGEKVQTVNTIDDVKNTNATYVLLGIPEDVGVFANFGKRGTSEAWEHCLKGLLNMQANSYTHPENLIVLGEIDCSDEMDAAAKLSKNTPNFENLIGALVTAIDRKVSNIVKAIVSSGKIPIVIGGGHNNAFGNLKGTAQAIEAPINVINFDAHTDFRTLEHRHSGNGFSYAMEQGFIDKYVAFGIHKAYTSQEIFDRMHSLSGKIDYHLFEAIQFNEVPTFNEAMQRTKAFVQGRKYGLEIDVDAIENFPSSALSPSGFTMKQARTFLHFFTKDPELAYVHICEAAPNKNKDFNVGKALAYFVTDIIAT